MKADVYKNLEKLSIKLPDPLPKGGLYQPVKQCGNLLYVSGQGSIEDGKNLTGRVGAGASLEEAQHAARVCGLNTVAALQAYLGDLNRIKQCVKILGFVAGVNDFTDQPKAMNGCSQLFVDVFGENGGHARSAIGTNSLPLGLLVEVESIWEIE